MGLRLDETGLFVTKNGRVMLNTNDKFLHGNTYGFPISGSVLIPRKQRGGDVSHLNETNTWNLASAPSGHTIVYGTARVAIEDPGVVIEGPGMGLVYNRWTSILGGNVLWVMDGDPQIAAGIGSNAPSPYQHDSFYFRISGGFVQLVQRVFIPGDNLIYGIYAHRVTYKLRTGFFT